MSNEKKTEVKNVEKVETKETTTTSSYVQIKDLSIEDIKSFPTASAVFVPRINKLSKSYTYELTLNSRGLIINSLADQQKVRENISLDEFNEIRLSLGKLDPYFLSHQFEGNVYYRLVKGVKQDESKYYCIQFWLTPNSKCHIHFFSQTEIKFMKVLMAYYGEKFNFIEKPKDITEEEENSNSSDFDNDIL